MNLLSAMPGLSAHETKIPVPLFNIDKAVALLREGLVLVNSFYPPGAMEWLRENRPDIAEKLKDYWKDIDKAINAEDMPGAMRAADKCVNCHREAFAIFETRPPVIEVQPDLLAA